MKLTLVTMLLTLSLSAQAFLTNNFFEGKEYSGEDEVLLAEIYEKELKKPESVLRARLEALAAFNDAVFRGDYSEPSLSVDLTNFTLLYSGKSGAALHYDERMYSISVQYPGSGAMTQTVGFLVVSSENDGMAYNKPKAGLTIKIHKVLPFEYSTDLN